MAQPEVVKVACNRHGEALYFSRSPIPFQRAFDAKARMLRHVGIYAFRAKALATFVSLKPSPLEVAESLEQLRALEYGLTIQVIETKYRCLGVDTPADLARDEAAMREQARRDDRKQKQGGKRNEVYFCHRRRGQFPGERPHGGCPRHTLDTGD